jgi:hypothetical protein
VEFDLLKLSIHLQAFTFKVLSFRRIELIGLVKGNLSKQSKVGYIQVKQRDYTFKEVLTCRLKENLVLVYCELGENSQKYIYITYYIFNLITMLNGKQKTIKYMNIVDLFLITHAAKYVMTVICLSEKEKSLVLH